MIRCDIFAVAHVALDLVNAMMWPTRNQMEIIIFTLMDGVERFY